jgi:hypothetical protein
MEHVGARRRALRERLFVGRERELEAWREALASPDPPRLWLVHGPGGIGKTCLLERFATVAAQAGAPVVALDLGAIEPTPDAVWDAFDRALAAAGDRPRRWVLQLERVDAAASLDAWLWETFLPRLADDALIVVASRSPRAHALRVAAAWPGLHRTIELGELDADDSRAYLARRRVPRAQHDAILAFARGYPLALSLIADLIDQTGRPFEGEPTRDVLRVLLRRLIDGVASPAHQTALEVCAAARATHESLLAAVLGPDAREAFDWLGELSFLHAQAGGLAPHDLVRDVIWSELAWRAPDRLRDLRTRVLRYYLDRMPRGRVADQQRATLDALFLYRDEPIIGSYARWPAMAGLTAEVAGVADRDGIRALVARHEGAESAAICGFWLERQPEGMFVVRDADRGLAGFFAVVALDETTAGERRRDPVADAVWRALVRSGRMVRDRPILLNRFWMARDGYQQISAVQGMCTALMAHQHLARPHVAHSFGVFAEPDRYASLFAFTGFVREADVELDGRRYGVFGHDWRGEPPLAWLRRAILHVTGAPLDDHDVAAPRVDQPAFTQAVHAAVRMFGEPHRLADSPLLASAMVERKAGADATAARRVEALIALIREAAQALLVTPRGEKLYLAVERTYLDPVGTQEEAAEDLDLPFGTYRRYLTRGLDELAHILWQSEQG